jgi:hypothetical protein
VALSTPFSLDVIVLSLDLHRSSAVGAFSLMPFSPVPPPPFPALRSTFFVVHGLFVDRRGNILRHNLNALFLPHCFVFILQIVMLEILLIGLTAMSLDSFPIDPLPPFFT